jgi:hypothetical protein
MEESLGKWCAIMGKERIPSSIPVQPPKQGFFVIAYFFIDQQSSLHGEEKHEDNRHQ